MSNVLDDIRVRPKAIDPQPIDARNAKALRRLMAEVSSPRAVQPTFNRIFLKDIDQLQNESKNRFAELLGNPKSRSDVPTLPSPSEIVAFINDGGETAVISVFRKLRNLSAHNALRDVASALAQAMAYKKTIEVDSSNFVQSQEALFLDPILRLESKGNTDFALDLLYDKVDELLKSSDFETLNQILVDSSPEKLSIDIILGLLTSSLPARSKLPARADFFEKSESVLRERGEYEEGLLSGLEP